MRLPSSLQISIHPPRAGWDRSAGTPPASCRHFNPPTPCGVGRVIANCCTYSKKFQSTHPVRGGTAFLRAFHPPEAFQSTHPVRGGTRIVDFLLAQIIDFNPPTPCGVGRLLRGCESAGDDFNPPTPCGVGPARHTNSEVDTIFQSTHPVRGGTLRLPESLPPLPISIHPPRAGWDRGKPVYTMAINTFQSTHPVRGGTGWTRRCRPAVPISIHPPRAGWDQDHQRILWHLNLFQSTHPVRGGTVTSFDVNKAIQNFNPPTPCGVGLRLCFVYPSAGFISIHPPRAGWDQMLLHFPIQHIIFQSTHPVRGGT